MNEHEMFLQQALVLVRLHLSHLWFYFVIPLFTSTNNLPNNLFIDHTFSFFPSFCPFIIDNCNYGSLFREGIKIKIFFTFNNNLSKN